MLVFQTRSQLLRNYPERSKCVKYVHLYYKNPYKYMNIINDSQEKSLNKVTKLWMVLI